MTATLDPVDLPELSLADPPPGVQPGDGADGRVDFFRVLNRWLMIPATRAGLGAWMSTPIGGAMVLLLIRGRKSGVVRETPLNYVIADGSMWVLAGFGPRSEWYRNLQADPRVEAILPGRRISGSAQEVRSPAVRRRIMPMIMRSTLGPSLAAGVNPFGGDEALAEQLAWVPLLRIDADEGWLDAGPDDPGGKGWIWRQGVVLLLSIVARALVRRVVRRLR